MTSRAPATPHHAFLVALGRTNTTDPDWATFSVGFHVMRMFDLWCQAPDLVDPGGPWVAAAIDVLDRVDDETVRTLLARTIHALTVTHSGHPGDVAATLMEYGIHLRETADQPPPKHRGRRNHTMLYDLSADVLATIADQLARDGRDADLYLLASAYLEWGITGFASGHDWTDAEERLERADAVATRAGDIVFALRARTWRTRIWIERGNVRDADEELRAIIAEARLEPTGQALRFAQETAAHLAKRHTRSARAASAATDRR